MQMSAVQKFEKEIKNFMEMTNNEVTNGIYKTKAHFYLPRIQTPCTSKLT
jgi:hypothetical protein